MVRKNFTVGQDVADLLDEHPDDNHSEIVRKLLRAYYTTDGYDVEKAAIEVRKQELSEHLSELEAKREDAAAELERLDELSEDAGETDVETWLDENWNATDPSKATKDNPLIQRFCDRTGNDPAVVAEAAWKRTVKNATENLSTVNAD